MKTAVRTAAAAVILALLAAAGCGDPAGMPAGTPELPGSLQPEAGGPDGTGEAPGTGETADAGEAPRPGGDMGAAGGDMGAESGGMGAEEGAGSDKGTEPAVGEAPHGTLDPGGSDDPSKTGDSGSHPPGEPPDPPPGETPPGGLPGPDDMLVLVNKTYGLPEDYVPGDLIIPDVPFALAMEEIKHLRSEAARALEDLFAAAAEEGYELYARSGYRSYATQKSLYDGYVRRHGREAADRFSARPGHSEHQTGLAMDITSPSVDLELKRIFGDTEEGRWVAENAHRFGFIIRYPRDREEVTGYTYEPWHLRYVGPGDAAAIFEQGATLEQYTADLYRPEGD